MVEVDDSVLHGAQTASREALVHHGHFVVDPTAIERLGRDDADGVAGAHVTRQRHEDATLEAEDLCGTDARLQPSRFAQSRFGLSNRLLDLALVVGIAAVEIHRASHSTAGRWGVPTKTDAEHAGRLVFGDPHDHDLASRIVGIAQLQHGTHPLVAALGVHALERGREGPQVRSFDLGALGELQLAQDLVVVQHVVAHDVDAVEQQARHEMRGDLHAIARCGSVELDVGPATRGDQSLDRVPEQSSAQPRVDRDPDVTGTRRSRRRPGHDDLDDAPTV